jgi:hypothetical protein
LWGSAGAGIGDPTGEAEKRDLRLDFNRRLLLQLRGSAITSDAGLLAYRQLDGTRRMTDTGAMRWLMCAPSRTVALASSFAPIGVQKFGWLRGCERRRPAVPRPGDALPQIFGHPPPTRFFPK